MSKAIDRFNAEMDQELRKILHEASQHYFRLSEEIEEVKENTEKRIIGFYREHLDGVRDVFTLIQEEVQGIMLTASAEAGSEPTPEERKKLEDIIAFYSGSGDDKGQNQQVEQSLEAL